MKKDLKNIFIIDGRGLLKSSVLAIIKSPKSYYLITQQQKLVERHH